MIQELHILSLTIKFFNDKYTNNVPEYLTSRYRDEQKKMVLEKFRGNVLTRRIYASRLYSGYSKKI